MIRKRYVDDTEQNKVDIFLNHLNQQHPSIRFTMETENDNRIAFLDSLVTREPEGKLHISVYRKPTHTDQYLAYDSHHPQSIKRGIVKCLHDRAKRIITKPEEKQFIVYNIVDAIRTQTYNECNLKSFYSRRNV